MWGFVFLSCFVVRFLVTFLVSLLSKRELVGLLKLWYVCLCSVSLPRGTMGCSTVCDCGVSGHTHVLLNSAPFWSVCVCVWGGGVLVGSVFVMYMYFFASLLSRNESRWRKNVLLLF